IIVTGANDLLTAEEIERARPAIAAASVLVCQLEIPVETSLAALRVARDEGVTTVFNPAPARAELPEELYRLSDVICPNEPETELLVGRSVTGEEDAHELPARGAGADVRTLSERGSLIVTVDAVTFIPVASVSAIATT